jgi:hypothetical protein
MIVYVHTGIEIFTWAFIKSMNYIQDEQIMHGSKPVTAPKKYIFIKKVLTLLPADHNEIILYRYAHCKSIRTSKTEQQTMLFLSLS